MDVPLFVAGVAQSRYTRSTPEERLEESIYRVTAAALADAGITRDEVDNVVIAASDALDGRAISSMLSACSAGAYLKDEIKVADEGGFAVLVAAMRLLTGQFETSLIVSWSRPSECELTAIEAIAADPFFTRPFGLTHATTTGLLATHYRSCFELTDDITAAIVARSRANGVRNPTLESPQAVTAEEVLASPYVAYPVRTLELAVPADGVAAVVLTRNDSLVRRQAPLARLAGMGWATDAFDLGERDLLRFSSLGTAAMLAYRMAEISNPLDDLDVAEIADLSAYHELLAYEALGLSRPGEAARLIESGATAIDGALPVNPSGGCLSAWPVFSAGLTRLVESCLQVAGRAGARQVSGARTALAHACSGYAGQKHAVMILQAP